MADKKNGDKDTSLTESARILGRAGGRKGGPARDRALSHEQKVKIAREGGLSKAAKAKAQKSRLKPKKKKGK